MPGAKPLIISPKLHDSEPSERLICGPSENTLYHCPLKLFCRGQIFAYERTATLRLLLSIIKSNGRMGLSYETT